MLDMHVHILPGLDDGSPHLEESLAMARIAVEDGIDTIIATPHVMKGIYNNSRTTIIEAVQELQQKLDAQNIALTLKPGAEYYLEPDLPDKLAGGELLTLNNGPYLLVELPSASVPAYTSRVIYELQLQGIIPVLAHPERNAGFMSQPELLREYAGKGILAQVTTESISGALGKTVQKTALKFIRENLVHFVASDAHSASRRIPVLSPAVQVMKRHYNDETILRLVQTNPAALASGQEITAQAEDNDNAQKIIRIKPFNLNFKLFRE